MVCIAVHLSWIAIQEIGRMDRILNFGEPLDINLLDSVVRIFYSANHPEVMFFSKVTYEQTTKRAIAEKLLTSFQEHPDAWTRVDTILECSTNSNTRFLGLQILDSLIKHRWAILPPEQVSHEIL